MKKISILLLLSLMPTVAFSTPKGFIHPLDFDGSDAQKKQVITYIEADVKESYCNSVVDMCQDVMLRMMEESNLNAFRELTEAKDRKMLDKMIKDYCNGPIKMCNYQTIQMMYDENLKASTKKLAW